MGFAYELVMRDSHTDMSFAYELGILASQVRFVYDLPIHGWPPGLPQRALSTQHDPQIAQDGPGIART